MQESLEVAALPYQGPPIKTILILSSFLLLLNAINHVLDNLIYCGLVGQMLIGVAFGTPGVKWLDKGTEQVIVQLGYLGLILLVYQGGLNTNFKSLKANVGISALVTLIGICSPIAFAFSLRSLASATPLQSFAAGAALCSTSLGTTFTILSSSGLTNTRLGTVLTSAAMMDDVVGLVLVQVISKLGSNRSSFHTITVVRPIAGSVGLALLVLLTCRYLVTPFSSSMGSLCPSTLMRVISKHPDEASLIAHVAFLLGIVAAASYIGTSNLFAAYLAGASISWYYSEVAQVGNVRKNFRTEVPQSIVNAPVQQAAQSETSDSQAENSGNHDHCTDRGAQPNTPAASSTLATHEADGQMRVTEQMQKSLTGVSIYNGYIEQPVARLLNPFFFASIGFSIPVTRMFRDAVVWRGIVFSVLMLIGKLITGICLIRIALPSITTTIKMSAKRLNVPRWSCLNFTNSAQSFKTGTRNSTDSSESKALPNVNIPLATDGGRDRHSQKVPEQLLSSPTPTPPQATASMANSRSLYPAAILGTAMMARGEIGFLIAALAESTGIFVSQQEQSASRENDGSEIYLVAIWAIVLCTVIGPVSVGLLVKRVKKLQQQRRDSGGGEDPLGVWGVL